MKKCSVCGEAFPEYDLEPIFTGRKIYMCRSCLKEGRKQLGGRLHKHYVKHQKNKEKK